MKQKDFETDIKLLTIREAARLVKGLTEYRIRQLCLSGEIPCIKAGNRHLINVQTLIDFVNKPKGANENG